MIDIGSNLTHPKLLNKAGGLNSIVTTCREHNIEAVITIGTNVEESMESVSLAKQYPGFIYATAGIHPHYAEAMNESSWATLEMLINEPEVVAVGEMGLDFFRNFSPKQDQIKVFERQFAVNQTAKKPIYLHERDALSTQLEVLKANRSCFPSGVAHCFTGNTKSMKAYLDLDLYIGITGWICDERRNKDVIEAAKFIPGDRLLVETDSPFLLPRTLRPKPKDGVNRPHYLTEVIAKLAICRAEPPERIAEYTTENAKKLFQLPLSYH